MGTPFTSAIPGFYTRPLAQRRDLVAGLARLSDADLAALETGGLSVSDADLMIENVIGRYALPLGIATNFQINGVDRLVPMVVEEASVVAACSYAAKLFRAGGGIRANSDASIMTGQIQLLDIGDMEESAQRLQDSKAAILERANTSAAGIAGRGGGAIDLEARLFPDTAIGDMIVLHLYFDALDAMGANAINTALEAIAPLVESITDGRVNLRILSNLCDRRKAYASGAIPADALAAENASGEAVVDAIIEAAVFAEIDPYRAATHNKGIMNGVDALLIATGNDWRAAEAGAHAYAARAGQYRSLTRWRKNANGDLHGAIELPLALGIVGGATRSHPLARTSLKILGVKSARELAQVAAAVGLAQNLAAIRALATDGIQRGHMRLHARQQALAKRKRSS